MKFGICTSIDRSADVRSAGWDYVEENVQQLFQGRLPDEQWRGAQRLAAASLPVAAANSLLPPDLKIVGPDVDNAAIASYMLNVIRRAARCDVRTLVFGSGAARRVPDGFDRAAAREQIVHFLRSIAQPSSEHGVTIVVEPLHRGECNIVNTLEEAMQYVHQVNHPSVACLLDTYHLWMEDEPIEHIRAAGAAIRHVHVADKIGRVAPGESGQSDYRPVFAALKAVGYGGAVSVEAAFPDIPGRGPHVLAFLRAQWYDASLSNR